MLLKINVKAEKDVAFKNNAPFRSCMSKINSTLIDNAENLYIIKPMYNLLEYSQNYSVTSGSLWNYYRDKIDDVDDNASDGKSFEYKTKIVENTPERSENEGDPNRPPVPTLNVEVTIQLKNLSNFWRFLDLPLINCETELRLSWTKDCILIEQNNNIAGANFLINSTKLYKRTIYWNKNRSEITTQPKDNNLDYLIDSTFRNINRLFASSFKNGDNNPKRDSFEKYYMSLVEIKDFNALIDSKPFFISQLKTNKKHMKDLSNSNWFKQTK